MTRAAAPRLSRRRLLLLVLAATLGGAGGFGVTRLVEHGPWTLDPRDPAVTLEDVENEVARRFGMRDLDVRALGRRILRQRVTLFDVRTREEYETGHLPGAIWVDPDMGVEAFMRAHGERLADGAPVVFYCAVGVRSARLAARVIERVAPVATGGTYNLRGGVFRWGVEGLPLVAGTEPGEIHPFDEAWGELLKRTLAGL